MTRAQPSSFPSLASLLLSSAAAATFPVASGAQCTNPVIPVAANVGTDGSLLASAWWDPDGPGPANAVVVIGGDFTSAGTVASTDVATFDPATGTWGALPGLPTSNGSLVRAIAALPNGELVVAGQLGSVGGSPTRNIVRWRGTGWETLANGTNGTVNALLVDTAGGLIAAGAFTQAGSGPAVRIARFDGAAWSAMGSGLGDVVHALALDANGDVLAGGGNLTSQLANVARWNGTVWSGVGPALGGSVYAMVVDPTGLIVAGNFFGAGGVQGTNLLARWDGVAWNSLGFPYWQVFQIESLLRATNGDLVVGVLSGALLQPTLRFDGTTWSNGPAQPAIADLYEVRTMVELPGGDVLAGGFFDGNSGLPVRNLVRVSPTLGSLPVHSGLPVSARTVLARTNGDLVVGALSQPGYRTAWRRQAGVWSELAAAPTETLLAVVELPNGDLVFGGESVVARTDGQTWTSLGAVAGIVKVLLLEPSGQLLAGGPFTSIGGVTANGLARWNGTAWSAVSGWSGSVAALARQPNGELVVATANRVFQSFGSSWVPLGWNIADVRALAVLANGTLVAGGNFIDAGGTPANRIARWNGTIWQTLGSGLSLTAEALLPLPNGDLLVGGTFTTAGGVPANGLARWNGTAWSALGPGTPRVYDLAMASNGDVLAAGAFTTTGADAAASVVRFGTSCPALVGTAGAGCVGTGGANVLTTASLPWLGSTFRSVASGLAPSSIAVHVLGAGPASVPLPTVLPQATTGCVLQVTPDALAALPTFAGVASVALPIPNVVGLLGLVLHQQVVALELDPFANVTGATAGNVLVLTLGAY